MKHSQSTTYNKSKLKVCGLTQLSQIQALISIKTDFLGFIFYEKSPRYVLNHLNLKEISTIDHQGKVGVFVNESVEKIIEITQKANLNIIQLHGDEDENFIQELKKNITSEVDLIKVIRIGKEKLKAKSEIQKNINLQQKNSSYFLFDTDSKAFGGTGEQFDWTILNEIEIPLPYFLSGGISEKNIQNIHMLNQKPFAIDINSKFEIEPGIKNVDQIKKLKTEIR